jgi:hypothetical protein
MCNLKGIFWFLENKYVIKQKGEFFPTSKYFLFVADQENPVAEIKAWEGWTFVRPYIKLVNGKKYTFRKLKHTNNGLFWKNNKEAYYKVSLKHDDEDVLEYEFTKSPRTITDSFKDLQRYRNLQGAITFQVNDYCLSFIGLFLIERMLDEEDD